MLTFSPDRNLASTVPEDPRPFSEPMNWETFFFMTHECGTFCTYVAFSLVCSPSTFELMCRVRNKWYAIVGSAQDPSR